MGSVTRVLYWFRRDLRIRDNRALYEALAKGSEVIPLYILDDEILEEDGITPGNARFRLLLDLLSGLDRDLGLHVVQGDAVDVLVNIVSKFRIDAVFTSKPLPGESEKVLRVGEALRRMRVKYVEILDNVLSDPHSIDPNPNFTSFYKKWLKNVDSAIVSQPARVKTARLDLPTFSETIGKLVKQPDIGVYWGRKFLEDRLSKLESILSKYESCRDYPSIDCTSRLSPFISLGAVSVRELYDIAVRVESREFVRQLAWREYMYALYARKPWMDRVEMKPRMRRIRWENSKHHLEAFLGARTGYPIIDAGIRQLMTEGWIHNRVRILLASFLVKDLHVDWRIGADIFKKSLVDYDKAVNSGNWQWSASTGVDALPFRAINPMLQSRKIDPKCEYIYRYLPELEGYECRALHDPLKHKIKGYHEPIVNHYERIREYARQAFS